MRAVSDSNYLVYLFYLLTRPLKNSNYTNHPGAGKQEGADKVNICHNMRTLKDFDSRIFRLYETVWMSEIVLVCGKACFFKI